MWALLPLFAIVGAARAQSDADGLAEYLTEVCMPSNATGYPDLDVPCNAVAAIQAQCLYGPGWLDGLFNSNDSLLSAKLRKRTAQEDDTASDDSEPTPQSNEAQRVCLCQSQFWDQISGCMACYKAHGGDMAMPLEASVPDSALTSASSAYCAASATATAGLDEFLYGIITSLPEATASQETGTASVSFSDAIGNKTEASYYYTAAVTGSAAWSVSQPTGSASYTTTNVVDGQIRPTASQNNAEASGTNSPSGSNSGSAGASSTGNAAPRYEAAGAAGIFGFAGLLALL